MTTRMSTKEVADFFGISSDTLRFYEQKGVIPSVPRNKNGYRVYTDVELNWLYFALSMKRAGLSLEKITEFAQLVQTSGKASQAAQKSILKEQIEEIDKQIVNLRDTRNILQGKLINFDHHLGKINDEERQKTPNKEWQHYQK